MIESEADRAAFRWILAFLLRVERVILEIDAHLVSCEGLGEEFGVVYSPGSANI